MSLELLMKEFTIPALLSYAGAKTAKFTWRRAVPERKSTSLNLSTRLTKTFILFHQRFRVGTAKRQCQPRRRSKD